MFRIIKDGLMFRAIDDETGFKSPLFTSLARLD